MKNRKILAVAFATGVATFAFIGFAGATNSLRADNSGLASKTIEKTEKAAKTEKSETKAKKVTSRSKKNSKSNRKTASTTLVSKSESGYASGVDEMKTAAIPKAEAKSAGKSKASATSQARKQSKKQKSAGRNKKAKENQAAAPAVTDKKYGTIVQRYAAAYGVPVSLAHAVIRVESNYRPDARGSAGEIGLMQIKHATARMMGYSGSAKALYDPETNIKYGMKYLGMARNLSDGSTCGTILKYNAGHAATRNNPVSTAYCGKVKQLLAGI
ncbi:transglycosylase SLT domain-containing protein [Mesorhizobium sp. SB112]|uniref:transglycosylase SLT domain-containing protein n=1 Tax=Mesorhizobium sp. SB112 TaxID=3151853 RepID=UPI00326516BC